MKRESAKSRLDTRSDTAESATARKANCCDARRWSAAQD